MSAPGSRTEEEILDAAPGSDEQPAWQRLLTGSGTSITLVLVALIVAFSILRPEQFFAISNARNIAVDAAVLLVVATGLTYVIITAGIDLSVGSVLVFSSVASAKLMKEVGGNDWGVIFIGLAAALASGAGWGLLNGFLVTKAKIPSFIVTLGTLGMALGAALLITGGVDERNVPFKLIETIGTGRLFGEIPYLVLIAAAVALVFGVILAQTRFGRYTYAIGSNEEGTRRTGVNVDRHLLKVYALTGTLAGFAGFLQLARFGTTSVAGSTTTNLDSIAAIVIGGTSLFGGIGTILGTVVGVFIPAVLRNGFVIVGVQPFWQQVAVGAVLIGAVYVDQLRRARNAR
jgi:ribose transport system permease protein